MNQSQSRRRKEEGGGRRRRRALYLQPEMECATLAIGIGLQPDRIKRQLDQN